MKVFSDQFFGPATGLVDMIVAKITSPIEGALEKVRYSSLIINSRNIESSSQIESTYTGPQTSDLAAAAKARDPEGPVMVHVTKLYHATDDQSFRAFGRILSGTLKKGMPIKVVSEG
jgi:U5 small nuclear ribonucleoprotein component